MEENNIPKDSKILDVGCGTGKVGEFIYNAGYTNLEGFDGSEGMLEVSRKKGLYKKLTQGFVTVPEEMPKEFEGAFDTIVSHGLFIWPSHADPPGYECLVYCCKKGGFMLFGTDEYDQTPEEKEYKIKRDAMVKEGKWKKIKEIKVPKFQTMTDEFYKEGRLATKRIDTFSVYQKL